MIYKHFQDIKLSRLGMGNMRLPVRGGKKEILIDVVKLKMVPSKEPDV